jgi:hypothetical protein
MNYFEKIVSGMNKTYDLFEKLAKINTIEYLLKQEVKK